MDNPTGHIPESVNYKLRYVRGKNEALNWALKYY